MMIAVCPTCKANTKHTPRKVAGTEDRIAYDCHRCHSYSSKEQLQKATDEERSQPTGTSADRGKNSVGDF